MTVAEELERLQQLHQSGELNDEEYLKAKADVLNRQQGAPQSELASQKDVNQWAMFIHLSQLASMAVPGAGVILPIVLWQIKKDEMPDIDAHGKNVANWIISLLIYLFVSGLLCFVFIGFLLLPVLVILSILFPILGGLKANNGEVWKYPMAISFLK